MIDTFGKWFLEFEKRNEHCDIICGIYDSSGHLETRLYPHSRYDGYSIALAYLNERSNQGSVKEFIETTGGELPSMSRLIHLLVKSTVILCLRPRPRHMKRVAHGWPAQPIRVDKARIAWRILDEPSSRRIPELARANHSTTNAWIIAGFLPPLKTLWADMTAKISCGVTISLHKYQKFGHDPLNRFGLINLTLDDAATPGEITRQIRHNLRQGLHLAAWASYYLPHYFGNWFYRFCMPLAGFFQARNVIFTNLGEIGGNTGDTVFMIPPVLHFNPVSFGSLTWEGKTAITLQLHPHLDTGPDTAEQIMEHWVKTISGGDVPDYVASSATVQAITPKRVSTPT